MDTNHRMYTANEVVTVFGFSVKDLNDMHKYFSAIKPKRTFSYHYYQVENFRPQIDDILEVLERTKSTILKQDEDKERKKESKEKLEEWRSMELKKEKKKIKNNKKIQKKRERQKLLKIEQQKLRIEQQEDALVREFEKKLSEHHQRPKQKLSQEIRNVIIESVVATK
jgi:hypothetical protein